MLDNWNSVCMTLMCFHVLLKMSGHAPNETADSIYPLLHSCCKSKEENIITTHKVYHCTCWHWALSHPTQLLPTPDPQTIPCHHIPYVSLHLFTAKVVPWTIPPSIQMQNSSGWWKKCDSKTPALWPWSHETIAPEILPHLCLLQPSHKPQPMISDFTYLTVY